MLEERECKICGVWFQPKRKNNIYCEECSKRSGAKKKKMKRQIMISISRCGTGNKQGEHNNMPRFQSENARKSAGLLKGLPRMQRKREVENCQGKRNRQDLSELW